MASDYWPIRPIVVASLHLDEKNPRLGRETLARAPREIIQYLFQHDKALEIAESIATRGYFPNEPLLAVKQGEKLVVIEGNRRLAALKALREPGLLDGAKQRQVERLSRRVHDLKDIASVPVAIAPSRRATDRQVAGRHIGTPVLAWEAENRASFILEKLEEGYTNSELESELGFSSADIHVRSPLKMPDAFVRKVHSVYGPQTCGPYPNLPIIALSCNYTECLVLGISVWRPRIWRTRHVVASPTPRRLPVVHAGGITQPAGDAISFGIIGTSGIDRSLP
jgi:hypothetical protein